MTLDAASLMSSLVTDLAREFPWATPEQLARAVDDSLSLFAEARVQAFLPVLTGREARRALQTLALSAQTVHQPSATLIDLTTAAEAVG